MAKKPEDAVTSLLANLPTTVILDPKPAETVPVSNEIPKTADFAERTQSELARVKAEHAMATGGQTPSIGRVVHYEAGHGQGPYLGHIVFVHDDRVHVNLAVFNHTGQLSSIERTRYGTAFRQWHWPARV